LIVDEAGRGIAWANKQLQTQQARVRGKYVWTIDDDDEATEPDLVAIVRQIGQVSNPELIVLRCQFPEAVLPSDAMWGKKLSCGHLGNCNFLTRADIWKRHIHHWGDADYSGDWSFFEVLQQAYPIYWCDVVIGRVRHQSTGCTEAHLETLVTLKDVV